MFNRSFSELCFRLTKELQEPMLDCSEHNVEELQQITELTSKDTLSRGMTTLVFKDSEQL